MSAPGWSLADLLPGLWVALVAAGLVWALGRWFDPVPRRILAVFALLLGLLFGPVLFGGRILISVDNLRVMDPYRELAPSDPSGQWIHGDLVFLISPWLHQMQDTFGDGRWPLWNHLAGTGMPLMGDPQMLAFQPLIFAAYPFPTWTGVGVSAALKVLVALVFTFLLLRLQGLGEAASLAGSLAFGLSGFMLLWLNWPIGNCPALMPVVLYALARCGSSGRARDSVLLCISAAAMFLAGHPETIVYCFLFAGLFLLSLCRARWKEEGRSAAVRLLVRCGAALALAGFLVAPVLLPVADYIPKTRRAAVVDYHFSADHSLGDLWESLWKPETLELWKTRTVQRLVPLVAPRAYGDHRTIWWGEINLVEDDAGFVGVAAALAALIALLPLRNRLRFPQEGLFLALLVACLALLAQPPGFDYLASKLPVIGATAVHRHHRIVLVEAFAVAYLAACQIERWQRGESRRAWIAAAAVVLGGLSAWSYWANPHPTHPEYLSGVRAFWLALHLTVIAGAAALFAWKARRPDGGARSALAFGVCGLVAAELLIAFLPANPPMPKRLAYPLMPPIRFLQEHLGDSRMIGIGPAFRASVPAVYGINDLRIDNPSAPHLYMYLTEPLTRPSMIPTFARPRHQLYDLLGVRYVMTRPGLNVPLKRVFEHPTGWIYERPSALPRLFLPQRAQILQGDGDWRKWTAENSNYARRALVTPSPDRSRRWRADRAPASNLTVALPEPARVHGRASLVEQRLLASSIFQDGHWRLLAGSGSTGVALRPTVYSNGPFVGAWLPAGEWDVELLYRPMPFVVGCLLSALAFAAAAALWVPRPRTPAAERVLS